MDRLPVTFGSAEEKKYDPHSWDDPDKPPLRERITPDSPKKIAIIGAIGTVTVGFGLYLTQVFPTAPLFITTTLTAGMFLAHYRGQEKAFRRIRNLDWRVMYDGDTAQVDYGEAESAASDELQSGEYAENGYVFKPGKSVDMRGRVDFLTVRDKFGTKEQIRSKMHRTGDTGDTPLRDYLPATFTSRAETDTLGDVYVTLTGGMDRKHQAPDIDRVAEHPDLIPRKAVGDISAEFETMMQIQIPALYRKHQFEKDRADELERDNREQILEIIDYAVRISQTQGVNSRQAARQAYEDKMGDEPGAMPTVQDYDQQVNSDVDEQIDRQ